MSYYTGDNWEESLSSPEVTGSLSPYEYAQQGGYLDDFTNYTNALYGGSLQQTNQNAAAANAAGVNLFQPTTFSNYAPQGYTPPGPPNGSPTVGPPPYTNANVPPGYVQPTWQPQYASGSGSSGGNGGGQAFGAGGYSPMVGSQYSDPYTQQYEGLANSQLTLYSQQQQAMLRQAYESETRRRAEQQAGMARMTDFVNQRVNQLQQPAYTGAEQEVLRTQLLDPLERDRTAAQKRALERVSARGLGQDSGIAHDLFRQVDQAFDEQRTRAQGGIAQSQIQEERGRSQEAQSLLQYLSMLPDAVARGDLDFVSYVQSLIAQPGVQSLAIGGSLSELGTGRLNDALATLGLGPSISGASAGAVNLLNQAQYQRQIQSQQQANLWGNIGRSFQV